MRDHSAGRRRILRPLRLHLERALEVGRVARDQGLPGILWTGQLQPGRGGLPRTPQSTRLPVLRSFPPGEDRSAVLPRRARGGDVRGAWRLRIAARRVGRGIPFSDLAPSNTIEDSGLSHEENAERIDGIRK